MNRSTLARRGCVCLPVYLAIVAAAWVVAGCGPKATATDPLWDPDALPVFRLRFDTADWEDRLEAAYDPFACEERGYERATVGFDNLETGETEEYADVGVRYRGHNVYEESEMERRGFKLSFDEFVSGREFHGVQHINLLGTEGDYTLLRERLALGVMAEMGVPAPRVGHALVTVNGKYMGIFPNSEEADDQRFLDAHFGEASPDAADGSYFKVKGYCGERAGLEWVSDDPVAYAGTYEPKAGTSDTAFAEELLPLLACASTGSDSEFATCIPDHIDVDEWLTEIAVDMALPDVDGMAGAGQNFLLYRPPEGRFVVVPWDKDLSLTLTNHPADAGGIFDLHPAWLENSQPMLVDRLRSVYREEFCAAVLAVAERVEPGVIGLEIDRLETLLEPDIRRDPFLDAETWSWIIEDLHEAVQTRHPLVVEEALTCGG